MTPLDLAYQAMAADEDQRLQFYERLADGEMFLLLEEEAVGADLKPRVFPLEDGPVVLCFDLEERLAEFAGGIQPYAALPGRVIAHLEACGMPARIRDVPRGFSTAALMGRMRKDKKVRDGALRFVLLKGPGEAFTAGDVPPAMVESLLRDEGCSA